MRVIGWAGYYITKTRYIEAQFRQSAAASSFLTGKSTDDPIETNFLLSSNANNHILY